MFPTFTAFFTAIAEACKSLTTFKKRQSETDVIKTKKKKSKAVEVGEQIIFFIVSPRFPLFVAACPQAARFLLRSVPINDFAHAPDRMRASCTAFPSLPRDTTRARCRSPAPG